MKRNGGMAIQKWSEKIVLADLQDDPQFTDDLNAILNLVQARSDVDVVLNFREVTFLNSSNIAKLLKLRKQVLITNSRQLKLCGIATSVWGIFLVTGLDKIFEFSDDVSTALAGLQIDGGQK
jgi:anti-anti-sigma factor